MSLNSWGGGFPSWLGTDKDKYVTLKDPSVHGFVSSSASQWRWISLIFHFYGRSLFDSLSWVTLRLGLFWLIHRALVVKKLPANAGDTGSIPGSGRSPGEGNGNPLQYSCLENPIDRGARWATFHGVTKSRTRLKWLSTHTLSPILWLVNFFK